MKLKNNFLHGRISISIVFIALIIGLVALIKYSVVLAIVYAVILFATPFIIGYGYCSHCVSNGSKCPHGIMGKFGSVFNNGMITHYTLKNYMSVIIPLIALVAMAQFGLFKNIPLLISYWVLFGISIVEIRLYVCPQCENEKCPLNKKMM
ncbi:MAG: hypothetical protein KAQ68_00565 [Clostridiales bacterium]|nr:hypothetical protein [Clostridiales bacterium]